MDAPPKAARSKNGRAERNGNARRPPAEQARDAPGARTGPGGSPAAVKPDSVERVLERIVAEGTESAPASSMYRIVDDKKPEATPSISYSLAKEITVSFRDGEVHEVKLEGGVRGIHLQPEDPKQKPKPKEEKAAPKEAAAAPSAKGSGRP